MNNYRYVMFVVVLGALAAGAVVDAGAVSAFAQFAVPDTKVAGLVPVTTLMSVAAAGLTFGGLIRSKRALQFVDEVVHELARVTWPSREETTRSTTVVISTALFVASLLAVYDFVWKKLADVILFNES
jgi:preprotein translocase SecE subunit